MRTNTLKYALFVFLGGASYGIMATTVKFAFHDGFSWTQVVASQSCFGMFIFGTVFLARTLIGKKAQKLSRKQILRLLGLGMSSCSTGILYSFSLTMLPVAVAITLLFQFTWIGVLIQIITTKRYPRLAEIIAVLIIFGGTFLANGFLESSTLAEVNPLGIVCGLGSAVSCAVFMFLSGRIENGVPSIQRGFVICCGAAMLGLIVCPSYFVSGALQAGIWKYGLILGTFGMFIPVIMFGLGTPHLPAGVSTILASSELPAAILVSVFLLGEPISFMQGIGVLVILSGVAVSQIPALIAAKAPPEEITATKL